MKIKLNKQSGFAAIFLLILIAIMTVYLVSNAAFLRTLKRQIQTVEQKQIERIAAGPKMEKTGEATEKSENSVD